MSHLRSDHTYIVNPYYGVGDFATSSPQHPDTGYRILTLKKAGYRIPDTGCRHLKKADTGCRIPDADT